jgi:hypothetical protein
MLRETPDIEQILFKEAPWAISLPGLLGEWRNFLPQLRDIFYVE